MLFITVPFIYTMDAYIKTGDEPNMMTPNGVNGHERVNHPLWRSFSAYSSGVATRYRTGIGPMLVTPLGVRKA